MNSIEEVRHNIDVIDEQLVQLIEQRGELVQSLIGLKEQLGLNARLPEREHAVLNALHQRHGQHFTFKELESIFKPIFDACVRMQLPSEHGE